MIGQRALVALFAILTVVAATSAATIETVPVGNPGNAPESYPYGFGSVEYAYRIGKYEVTNAEYVEFLNGVDPAGTNKLALYNANMSSDAIGGINFNNGAANGLKYEIKAGRERNPVVFVSWYDAIRFTNWLNNGQDDGNTETGSYTLLGGTPMPSNYASLTRNTGAKWWLPTFDELYKAAYHRNDGVTGNYWDFPFASNSNPFSDQPPGSNAPIPANTANFNRNDSLANGYNDGYAVTGSTSLSSAQNYLTNVGAYTLSQSPYGAFDQGGNVSEWSESRSGISSGILGGSWNTDLEGLRAPYNGPYLNSPNHLSNVGFRVAAFPEPSVAPRNVNIAVDFDSSNYGIGDNPSSEPVSTQPGFVSWNASWAFNNTGWHKTQFLTEGVEFELQAFRADQGSFDAPYLGNRVRGNRGGTIDELLQDFVFAEGSSGNFLYLTISGLPVGTYQMTTWHFDADFGSGNPPNYMQIEVGDQQAGAIATAATIVADHFPLGTSPQVFEFEVTSPNTVKEIIFRNDDSAPRGNGYRTRLNGFTLVAIPEPRTSLSLLLALSLTLLAGRTNIRGCSQHGSIVQAGSSDTTTFPP